VVVSVGKLKVFVPLVVENLKNCRVASLTTGEGCAGAPLATIVGFTGDEPVAQHAEAPAAENVPEPQGRQEPEPML
jgi:hypothetical protein